jgi:hypothetical protein
MSYHQSGDMMGDMMGDDESGYYAEGDGDFPGVVGEQDAMGNLRFFGRQQGRRAAPLRFNPGVLRRPMLPTPRVVQPYGMAVPDWRQRQMAPGVQSPQEQMLPLTFIPQQGGGVFTAALASIDYVARPQKPFRGERLVVDVRRNGASAQGLQVRGRSFSVGTDLQQASFGDLPLEVFAANAFGVRLFQTASGPGIDVNVTGFLSGGVLAGADTISLSIVVLGRIIMP